MTSPYRHPERPLVGPVAVEPDPFPTIECHDCGRRTTSASGEDLCAACDLRWLMRGIDWSSVMLRTSVVRVDMTCAICGSSRYYPEDFPNHEYAECSSCVRGRMTGRR